MLKKIVYLYSIFICSNIFGQIHYPDSVTTNKEKVIYLIESTKNLGNDKKALTNIEEAIRISSKLKNDSLLMVSYFLKSFSNYYAGDMKQAMRFVHKADSLNKNYSYYNYSIPSLIANIHSFKGENEKAIVSMTKAISAAEKNNKPNVLVDAYSSISLLFSNSGYSNKAKTYNLKALEIINKHPEFKDSSFKVYINLILGSDTYQEVLKYSNKIEEEIDSFGKKHQAYYFIVLGDKLIKLKKHTSAKKVLEKGIKLCKETNYTSMLSIAKTDLGIVYAETGQFKKAIDILEKRNKEAEYNLEIKRGILFGLSKAYEGVKNYKNANIYLKKYIDINDSIAKLSSKSKFAEFDAKFKTAEKDKKIVEQKLQLTKEKSKRNKFIFGSLLLLLIGFLGFQWQNSIQKQKKLATENQLKTEKEINELRTKFLGNIAHEIRTPLTLITGNLELAKENIAKKEKALQNIDVALTNSKKVVQDANEILELLKFEKNKTTIKLNDVDLDTTLKRIFYSFKSLAELKYIDLDYNSAIPKGYIAKIDVEKVEKILNNLISNAVKYSPSNSKIIFEAFLDETKLIVDVTDFGQGIHFNETEKIFQRFYQASNSQSVGGIGIGLSLAKEFANLLKGDLTVKSQLQKGSTFTLTIPIEKSETKIADTQKDEILLNRDIETKDEVKSQITTGFNQTKKRILIVEDNPEMNNYLVEILSDTYQCTQAFNGLEALEILKKHNFDLITSDIMMPNMDGFEFREAVNKDSKLRGIPFILISAKTLPEDKIRGFQLGIDDYIIKPFNKNELLARITGLIKHKEERDKWQKENKSLVSLNEKSDKKLLQKIEKIILDNISNENYKIANLAKEVGYSQRQLTRLIKQYTGMSPVKFILEIRLQKAYANIQHNTFFTLSEVRYDVGIISASYFNKKFKERFGISPTELIKN